ncbi:hypothetical protein ES703_116933 [subsurface metagenome]
MKQRPRFLPGIKCPRCWDRALITTWRPPRGIDPGMREYRCGRCKLVTYKVMGVAAAPAPSLALGSR